MIAKLSYAVVGETGRVHETGRLSELLVRAHDRFVCDEIEDVQIGNIVDSHLNAAAVEEVFDAMSIIEARAVQAVGSR